MQEIALADHANDLALIVQDWNGADPSSLATSFTEAEGFTVTTGETITSRAFMATSIAQHRVASAPFRALISINEIRQGTGRTKGHGRSAPHADRSRDQP
jgi:hypothetical protein